MAANGAVNNRRRHEIPPKPIAFKQDMEGYSVPVALSELIDNALRAGALQITVQCGSSGVANNLDVVDIIRCHDNGCGMDRATAQDFMRLAHTDSGLVFGFREPKKPLSAAQYFSKQLSRHGKGALALLYFGNKIIVESKVSGLGTLPVEVKMDYGEWLREAENCRYCIDVIDYSPREGVEDDDHYTEITIRDLKREIVPDLSDNKRLQKWAAEIADTYYFHRHGFPERLWKTMPEVLKPKSPPQVAAGGRPIGGVKVDLFGCKVNESNISQYISKFLKLQEQHGDDTLRPFWLPIRWCPPGLSPDAVPSEVQPSEGFSTEGGGPAGKLDNVHRDFLLLLLYFPTNNGSSTKPEIQVGGTDVNCLFAIWSGRVICDAECVRTMPAFVQDARKGKDGEHKLTNTRLGGFLFCSPEVYTTNHKTNFQDPAFKRVMQLGSNEGNPDYQDLWVWNKGWQDPATAMIMLQAHFRECWRGLEQDGELINPVMDPATKTRKASVYRFANRVEVRAGDLVRVRTQEELQEVELAGAGTSAAAAAAAAGSSGRGHGASGSGGARARARNQRALSDAEYPNNYRVVMEFLETESDSTGHKVVLRQWAPSWCPPDFASFDTPRQVGAIARLTPDESARLKGQWEALAPHHLQWIDPIGRKVHEHVTQLPGVPGTDTMSAAQVPASLTVALVTEDHTLHDKWRWGADMHPKHLSCDCTLTLDGKQIMRASVKYVAKNLGFMVNRLGGEIGFAKGPGTYVLKFTPLNSWVQQPISYSFKVVESLATKLEAGWSLGSTTGVPEVQLGQSLPELKIATVNENNTVATLPFVNVHDPIPPDVLKVSLKPNDASYGNSIKFDKGVPTLSLDRTAITVNGRLPLQKLQSKQILTSVNIQLDLTRYGGSKLQPSQQVYLHVLSGEPDHIFSYTLSSPDDPVSSTRGTLVVRQMPKLVVVDAAENAVDLKDKAYSACFMFKPPTAAAASKPSGSAAAAEAAGSSASAAAGRRRKGTVAPYYECPLDGNVLDFNKDCQQLHQLRWMAAPEESVTVTAAIFKSPKLPEDPSRHKPAFSYEIHFKMQKMHAALQHPLIEKLSPEVNIAYRQYLAARWSLRARGGREQQQDRSKSTTTDPEAYELNTWDNCPADILAVNMAEAAVPEQVKQRLQSGYELRRDVLSGHMMDMFITPGGSVLPSNHRSDLTTRLLPRTLVEHWNRLPKAGVDRVLDVVFVVPPLEPQLDEISIQMCDESDKHDYDFRAQAKLVVETNGQRVPVYPTDPTLSISGGELTLPAIPINRSWFHTLNRGTAKLLLLDLPQDDQQQQQQQQQAKELGCIYVRLAPHAERLQVVPAGAAFQGVCVTGRFGNETEPERRVLLSQEVHSAASASSSSSSSSAGAWAPWRTQKPGSAAPTAARSGVRGAAAAADLAAVQHRDLSINDPIKIRLGEPVTLHFVALDLVGCPVAITQDQADRMSDLGVTVAPDQLPSPAAAAAGASSVPFSITTDTWHFAGPPGTSQQQPLPAGHLGGLLVNCVTVRVLSGVGRAKICLAIQGSAAEPAVLSLPVTVEAGPVAVDGLWLKQVVFEQPAAAAAAAAQVQRQQQPELAGVLVDRYTWEMLTQMEKDPAAAAAAQDRDLRQIGLDQGVKVKPDPEAAAQQQQQQVPPAAAAADVIELLESSDDESEDGVMEIDGVRQNVRLTVRPTVTGETDNRGGDQPGTPTQQQQQRQRQQSQYPDQLASLDIKTAALLYRLEVTEGITVRATIQLRDADKHEICDHESGKLLLLHHKGWQQPGAAADQQQQQQQQAVQVTAPVEIKQGRAELELQIGVGDHWLGSQLFEITPGAAAAAGAGSSSSTGELQKVLPVLLLLEIKPGNIPSRLELISDLRSSADGQSKVVTAAEALAAAVPAATLDQIGNPDQILGACNLGPATGRSPGGRVLVLQLVDHAAAAVAAAAEAPGSSSSGAPAVPGFSVVVHSRDDRALQLSALQPLRISLHRWTPPAAAITAGSSQQRQQQQHGNWVEVPGSELRAPAKLEYFGGHRQQQQQEGASEEDTAAAAAVDADDGAAAAAAGDPVVVYDVEAGQISMPEEAGIYKLCASYSASAGFLQVPALDIGPILLLPAQPSKLINLTLQRQQQPLPASSARRGRGRGKMLSNSAAAAAAEVPVAVGVTAEVISPDDLKSKVLDSVDLQLQDKWCNPWRAAAATLAAAAAAGDPMQQQQQQQQHSQGKPRTGTDPVAGILPSPFRGLLQAIEAEQVNPQQQQQQDGDVELGGRPAKRPRTAQWQQQQQQQWQLELSVVSVPKDGSGAQQRQQQQPISTQSLCFDADGVCVVQHQSLQQLGITGAGDYKVYATAVSCAAAAAAGSSSRSASDCEVPPVLLAHYRVARSVDRVGLERKKTMVQARLHVLHTSVLNSQQQQQRAAAMLQHLATQFQNLDQRLAATKQQQQQLQQQQQIAAQGNSPENAPPALLTRAFQPKLGPILGPQIMLHPRAVMPAQNGGWIAAAAAAEALQRSLFRMDPSWIGLHESGDLLGPMICLGSVERADVARVLTAFVDLSAAVVRNYQASQALRYRGERVQCYNLGQDQLLSRFAYDPNQQRQQQQQPRTANNWMTWHPQQLLQPTGQLASVLASAGVRWDAYDPVVGFIGFAENLIRLTPQQLGVRIAVQGRPDGNFLRFDNRVAPMQLGLRHTLWHSKLSNVMIFESEGHINRLRARLNEANRTLPGYVKVIALDGATYNVKMGTENYTLWRSPKPDEGTLLLPGVANNGDVLPLSEEDLQATGGALDLRLRHYMDVSRRAHMAQQGVEALRRDSNQLQQQIRQTKQELREAEMCLQDASSQQQREEPECRQQLQQLEDELQED